MAPVGAFFVTHRKMTLNESQKDEFFTIHVSVQFILNYIKQMDKSLKYIYLF